MSKEQEIVVIETDWQRIAAKAEKRVVEGEVHIMEVEERSRLRKIMEAKGLDLGVFLISGEVRSLEMPEDVGRLSRQAYELIKVFGSMDSFIGYCQDMLTMCVAQHRRELADGFVAKFVAEHMEKGHISFPKDGDLLKSRLEAIISATHNLFEYISQTSESEAMEVVSSECFALSLRERVLRGWEKAGTMVPRSKSVGRCGGKVIRTLPVAGLKKIVEYFAEG